MLRFSWVLKKSKNPGAIKITSWNLSKTIALQFRNNEKYWRSANCYYLSVGKKQVLIVIRAKPCNLFLTSLNLLIDQR